MAARAGLTARADIVFCCLHLRRHGDIIFCTGRVDVEIVRIGMVETVDFLALRVHAGDLASVG